MTNEKTVVLELAFSKCQSAQPIINRLLKIGLSSATVLRGRVTSSDAWFQLELRGTVRAVEVAVRDHQDNGLCFTRFVPGLA